MLENLENANSEISNREQVLRLVSEKLKNLTRELVDPPLAERVLTNYPMPIALAYRRFQDARFNLFEQVLRLKDLFESMGFFIYNLMLADRLRRLDPAKYQVQDAGARRAYNGFSMAARLDFVSALLHTAATTNSQHELFIPDLVGTSVVETAQRLQDELRNRISHTATTTESQQDRLLKEFQPLAEDLLEDLSFLSNYRLVRIPSFHFKRGRLFRRVEVYKGVTPSVEEEILQDQGATQAEFDHVVMLSPEDKVLDLYPLYRAHQLLKRHGTQHTYAF